MSLMNKGEKLIFSIKFLMTSRMHKWSNTRSK